MRQKSAVRASAAKSKGIVPPLTRLRWAQLRFGRDDKQLLSAFICGERFFQAI